LKRGTPLVWTDLDTLDAFQHPDIVAMHGSRNCEGDGRRYRYQRPTPEQEREIDETLRRLRQADRQRLQDLDDALQHDAEVRRLSKLVTADLLRCFFKGMTNEQAD